MEFYEIAIGEMERWTLSLAGPWTPPHLLEAFSCSPILDNFLHHLKSPLSFQVIATNLC